ncbi:TetR family transcriptional regulator [Streptomyces seoulensis]
MTDDEPRRGRRRGRPDTRRVILDVARRRFLQDGYRAVTMRSIAAEADVDVALLSYYFGSKKGLFGAALALSANPAELLARLLAEDHALDTFPEQVLRQVLAAWEGPQSGAALIGMFRNAIGDDALGALVREALEGEIVERLADLVGGRDARRHAAAFTTVMAGLITARYVLRLEPVGSMSRQDVIRLFAPQLRLALGMPVRAGAVRSTRSGTPPPGRAYP